MMALQEQRETDDKTLSIESKLLYTKRHSKHLLASDQIAKTNVGSHPSIADCRIAHPKVPMATSEEEHLKDSLKVQSIKQRGDHVGFYSVDQRNADLPPTQQSAMRSAAELVRKSPLRPVIGSPDRAQFLVPQISGRTPERTLFQVGPAPSLGLRRYAVQHHGMVN